MIGQIETIVYKNGTIQYNYNVICKGTVGRLKFIIDGPNLYIPLIHINKGFRNKGIGTLLLNRVIKEARYLYCESVSLFVLETNTDAIRFYRRNGMFVTMTKKNRKASKYYLMTKAI